MPEHPQPPAQDAACANRAAISTATRPSPFASGPVAMVNQIRPGLGIPGQFPGEAMRTSPTQLSTPLVPQRYTSMSAGGALSGSPTSQRPPATSTVPDASRDSPGQAMLTPALGLFQHTSWPPSQQDRSRFVPLHDLLDKPPLSSTQHMQNNVPGLPGQMASDDPGRRSSASGPPTQQDIYTSLFDSPKEAMTSFSTLSRRSSLPSSHDPSPSIGSHPATGAAQQHGPYRQQQQSSLRAFGQMPPPAAPFLGYENSARLQSGRVPTPPPSVPDLLIFDEEEEPPQIRPTPSAATLRPLAPSQITLEAPSPDKRVDDFLKMPIGRRLESTENAVPHEASLVLDTVEGLEVLYAQKRWRSLTTKSLSMLQSPSNDINVTLEIKSWWLAGLIKDGQYDNAANVLDQIGNLDELLSTAGGASPFVPIRIFLLQALLSKCQGKVMNHEKQLFHLVLRLRSSIQESETMSLFGIQLKAAARWLRIAQFALVNHLVHQQKFMMALRICSQIDAQFMDVKDIVVVLSRVGRIRLQMGDLTAAEKLFEAARNHASRPGASRGSDILQVEVVGELEARLLLNDGLLFFAQNKLQEALSAFDSVLHLQNAEVLSSTNTDAELFLDEDVVSSAVNNYAVCALYCCDVKAAVVALERMIKSNPKRFLNGVVVFNLSSLYDLQLDNATSKSRKEMMKKIAHLYGLEHVDPAAYRI
ncbi:unnamed protein product [Hyaloperonospora brassicae]|uniref:Uncharacterized protein n=1 Tax=Hyaloperonospora brassicae TaxID=162125 RepID=A0AAV0TI50_HYABA|nr:unnamed protein product [Hyaloperonospora brassicae]